MFVTGGTGYLGRRLIPVLVGRGHRVRVLTRSGSIARVPPGAEAIVGDALDARSYATRLTSPDTLVHLVGTPHPSPAKAAEFRRVDLPSIQAAVAAATTARISHLVYVSVAHPAPIMKAYIEVRSAGSTPSPAPGSPPTVLRPWYVRGPGHRWPADWCPCMRWGSFRHA